MSSQIDILPAQRRRILRMIEAHLPDTDVWAFGSRVKWTSDPASDLDLVAFAGPEQRRQVVDLREAFEESNLPFRVDVLVWDEIPESFREEIDAEHLALVECTPDAQPWCTLGDLAHITMGQSPPGVTVNGETGTPLLNGPTEFGPHHPTPRQYTSDPRRVARGGDLLFCVRGSTTGRMNWADREYAIGRGIAAIRHRNGKHLQPFVRAIIESRLPTLLAGATGSVFRNVSGTDLTGLPIPDLPVRRQSEIAHNVGILDDRIELNRRICDTLEAMVRAIYKDWFVDFGPVRAKMEGDVPYLPSPLWELFPDRLVDRHSARVPEGWSMGSLHDIATMNPESWSATRHPDRVLYVDLTNAKWGRIERAAGHDWHTAPTRARRALRKGDTIVATVRPGNGSFALIDGDGLTGSTAFAVLRPKVATDRALIWCAATAPRNITRLAALADGAAYPAVRPSVVAATSVPLADAPTRRAFANVAGRLLDATMTCMRESRGLADTRDTMAHHLIRGDVAFPDIRAS